MPVELVRTTTGDGVKLDGCLALPHGDTPTMGVDAFLLLHGVGGSFYGGSLFAALSEPLLQSGAAVLRVNTRGHGSVSILATDGGPLRGGAAFEVVDQCRYDLAAWVEWLAAQGYQRVCIVGHSLGAIKAVYAAAHGLSKAVMAIVAASPPRLSCSAFRNSPRSGDFLDSLSEAKLLLEEGRPAALLTAKFPFPLLISAASYVDKYGGERYNVEQLVSDLQVPLLFTYGQVELDQGGVAFAGLPEAILGARTDPRIEVRTIPAADHFYTGVYPQLAAAITDWLPQATSGHPGSD